MNNKEKPSRDFKGIWIPSDIWLSQDLNTNEKLFLVEIDSLDNEEGCFASNDYFSDFFKLSKPRCSEIIKSLEKKGYVTIKYTYKNKTKAIDKRIIKVLDKSKWGIRETERGIRETERGIRETEEGYSENLKDNNTVFNNTVNNTVISTTHSDDKHLVVDINKELIEKETHLIISSVHKLNKVRKMDKERLSKSICIFKERKGKYFSLLEKIYNDDGNFIKKEPHESDSNPNNSITNTYNNMHPKTRFHNINQTFTKYEPDELEKMLLENQKGKWS